MEIFDFYATTIYLVSIFIFTYFIRPIIKKLGKDTKWKETVIPVVTSLIVGSIGFWMIKRFSSHAVTFESVMWYIFLLVAATKVYEKSEVLWKLLGSKFDWIKKKRPGKGEDE